MKTPAAESIDLKQFNQVFFEECAENLAEMEQILISLGDREPDHEELNAIFRAAHSIKGGAGIFGFDDMAASTHAMESLLDRLRNQEIAFDSRMIELLLEAGDLVSLQLAGHREGKQLPHEAIAQMSARLTQVYESGQRLQVGAADVQTPGGRQEESRGPAVCRYRVVFTPDADLFTRGVRVEGLIAELASLALPGEFHCRAELTSLPSVEELKAESCITRWNFTLATKATADELRDVFIFAADEEQLCVSLLGEEEAALPEQVPSSEPAASTDDRVPQPAPYAARPGNEQEGSIRVNVAKLDQLVNQVGELLITQSMLARSIALLDPVLHEELQKSVAQLERNTRDLQGSVMSIRLVPISLVFNRFPRLVRELAGKLGKSVELKTSGGSTELDKGLIEKIADPLSHLVRNALDHGLETTGERTACGKVPTGTLQLRASQQGGRIVIEVIDDGRGLDRGRILAKAAERGIACSETMSDEEVWQLIFMPGFSTAEAVTDLSGRGVGMDVVLKNVQSIGGRVQVSSQQGCGTRVAITLPLTLAILDGLSVAVGGDKFIVPLNAVIESLQPKPEQLKSVNGIEVVQVRDQYLPILRLNRLFDLQDGVDAPERGILVLAAAEGENCALLVDALLDEQQVVVKSLEANFRKVEGSAGATILGDGRVALILDMVELFGMHKRQGSS